MGCVLLCLTLLVLLARSYAQPPCTLILPKVLHVEREETIVLDAQGQVSPFDAIIEIREFPHGKHSLAQVHVSVNSTNNFLGIVKLLVPPKYSLIDPKEKQFVYVTVKSSLCPLEKVIPLSSQSGYIVIQTDKSICTPGSIVLCRIFKMNHMLQPFFKPAIIEFKAPDGLIVKRDIIHQRSNLGIISYSYRIPDLMSLGVWTILAKYEDSPEQNFTTNFEVKEYVLPSLEVSLLPRKSFFYEGENTFELKIKAQFLCGKPVEGKAFVLFGVKKDGVKRGIPDTLRAVLIEKGEGECSMDKTDLLRFFGNNEDMSQFTLYVSVTVITKSGGELVEAMLENIQMVTSPYTIIFRKTPTYFKPGIIFYPTVFVTNPDGSPASGIPVVTEPGKAEGITQEDGTVKLTLTTTPNANSLTLTVRTALPGLPLDRQASATMTATAYQPLGTVQNFLQIDVTSSVLTPGENVAVNFFIRSSDPGVQNQIQHVTYLIINKGRIMTAGRQPRQASQALVTMSIEVTERYIPSFRILAYYNVQTAAGREIVSDSVWVDVKDTCMGTLELSGEKDADNAVLSPGTLMKLKLRADHKAVVGLVAVDKGVHVINKKYKITQSKIWDMMEKSDLACTLGGGADNEGAFNDAGLSIQTNFKIKRSESLCPAPLEQKQRSSEVTVEFEAAKSLTNQGHARTCCEDGMKQSPVGESCERRSQLILDGKECADAFLDCCKQFEKKKTDEGLPNGENINGRSNEDDWYMPNDDILQRTEFPESWFWREEQMGDKPDSNGISTKVLNVFLKDSITTWEFLAVSLSETKGICVSEPYEIKVMKDFFIDMNLPYSVVRNEQVDIQAILHNYGSDRIKMRVELTHNPEFCSLSTSEKTFHQEVFVDARSSAVVSFIIVPQNLGDHSVEVKAAVSNSIVSDGVRKKLKVVSEGMCVFQTIKSVILDPQVKGVDGVQTETVLPLDAKNIVSNTEVITTTTITGTLAKVTLEEPIDGQNLNHLIIAASGNGEQNMITMTDCVIATIYLDATNQWEKIGFDRRAQAIQNIRQGTLQQLFYRKEEGSYTSSINRPSSTWLTAYVVKVFGLAQTLVNIDDSQLCYSIKWLILEKQKADGSFQEAAPVIEQEMTGGIRGSSELDSALTAFVLIALLESEQTCIAHVNTLKFSIDKAASFLVGKYQTLRKPYTVAITSYALAKGGLLDETKTLMAASTDNIRWMETGSTFDSVEATAYALLALLEIQQYGLTGPIVRRLNDQKYYGGGSGSTQATIIYFQAQAQYQQDIPRYSDLELQVSLYLPNRMHPIYYRINPINAMLARSSETRTNKEFVVEVSGKGQGTLKVIAAYNRAATEEELKCNNFDLSIKVTEVNDFEGNRHEDAYSTVALEICFRHLKDRAAAMSVVEVSMLTGFTPDVEMFKKLLQDAGNHVSKYEINNETTGKGSLVIYLDKISHTEEECVKVIAHQIFRVGVIQPAPITVYDYYNPESRCTKSYHLNKGSIRPRSICHGGVCRCEEV